MESSQFLNILIYYSCSSSSLRALVFSEGTSQIGSRPEPELEMGAASAVARAAGGLWYCPLTCPAPDAGDPTL